MKSRLPVLMVVLLLSASACHRGSGSGPDPVSPTTVALYDDAGCWRESVIALERTFRWAGLEVTRVSAARIRAQGLGGFRLLCVPGGDMYRYSQDLGGEGVDRIRQFVSGGGGYLGVCAGAYLAADHVVWRGAELLMASLALFPGTAQGPWDEIVPYPRYGLCTLSADAPAHPVMRDQPSSFRVLYYWGPALLPAPGFTGTVLARYGIGNRPAALSAEYGQGRVFLIGTHPEIEEGDGRDGVDFADELHDPESEWNLVRAAARWCVRDGEAPSD